MGTWPAHFALVDAVDMEEERGEETGRFYAES
jgi:hypothetical protein